VKTQGTVDSAATFIDRDDREERESEEQEPEQLESKEVETELACVILRNDTTDV